MNHDHGCNRWSWIKIDWILDQKSYELLWTAFSQQGHFSVCLVQPTNWGLWTHSLSLTWEPVRYANEQSHANHLLNQSLCFSHLRFGKPYRRWLHIELSPPPCSPIHMLRSIRTLIQGSLTSDISCLMIWGGTEVRIVEIKCTINVLESSPKPPTPWSLEKLSSMKLVCGAKEVALVAQNVTSLHIGSLWLSLGKMRSLEWALI